MHAVLGVVQFQARCIAAKAVGQENIAARVGGAFVEGRNFCSFFDIPHFGRVTGHEPHIKQVRAGRTVRHQPIAGFEQFGKGVGHRAECSS